MMHIIDLEGIVASTGNAKKLGRSADVEVEVVLVVLEVVVLEVVVVSFRGKMVVVVVSFKKVKLKGFS